MAATNYYGRPLVFTRPGKDIQDRLDVHFNEPRWDEFEERLQIVLQKFGHLQLDKAVKQFNVGLTTAATKFYRESGVLFLRGENVYERRIDLDSQTFVPLEKHEEWKSSQVKPGDIVINLVGNIGDACIIPPELERAQINRALGRIIPNPDIASGDYIMEFLNSDMGKWQLIRYSQGGMQRRFNHPDGVYVKIPTIEDGKQKLICARLHEIHERVKKIREIISDTSANASVLGKKIANVFCEAANLPEYPEQIRQKIITVQNSDQSDRLTFKFNIESQSLLSWKRRCDEKMLGSIGDYTETDPSTADPTSFNTDFFNYVDISSIDIGSKEISKTQRIPCADAPSRAKRRLTPGNILISTVRPQRGAFTIIPGDMEGAIGSTGFCQLRPTNATPPELVFFILFTDMVSRQMDMLCTGASYPAINEDDILSIVVPLVLPQKHSQVISECKNQLKEFVGSLIEIKKYESSCDNVINKVSRNFFSLFENDVFAEISQDINHLEDSVSKVVGRMQ